MKSELSSRVVTEAEQPFPPTMFANRDFEACIAVSRIPHAKCRGGAGAQCSRISLITQSFISGRHRRKRSHRSILYHPLNRVSTRPKKRETVIRATFDFHIVISSLAFPQKLTHATTPARSLLGRSNASAGPRGRNRVRPHHPRCVPPSLP
jgi:hypothetical protein